MCKQRPLLGMYNFSLSLIMTKQNGMKQHYSRTSCISKLLWQCKQAGEAKSTWAWAFHAFPEDVTLYKAEQSSASRTNHTLLYENSDSLYQNVLKDFKCAKQTVSQGCHSSILRKVG